MGDALVKELDRDMDAVFDNVLVLNAAFGALMKVLSPEQSARLAAGLDRSIAGMADEPYELGFAATQLLQAWRNQAAQAASLRPPGHAT